MYCKLSERSKTRYSPLHLLNKTVEICEFEINELKNLTVTTPENKISRFGYSLFFYFACLLITISLTVCNTVYSMLMIQLLSLFT